MKKLSRYVHLVEKDGQYYLFNVYNGRVMSLNKRLAELIYTQRDDIESVREVHPSLYEALEKSGMTVEETVDEVSQAIEHFEEQDRNPSSFGIIVNPTLDCNLRCWYCYETHQRGTIMTEKTLEAVKRLINNKLADERLKHLSVSFFGGEPLLGWKNVVVPLLSYAAEECGKRGVSFSTGFTTNGVLLTEAKYEMLSSLGLGKSSFQISFDGHKIFHDKSRIGATKQPTYYRIMTNVKEGAKRGFKMNLRFNYTPETLDSFMDVLGDILEFPEETHKNIYCNFQQVWQTQGTATDVKERAEQVADCFRQAGFATDTDRIFHRHVCYADRENCAVVNYDGNIFKCTAREFSQDRSEGLLTDDGNIEWNERFYERMAVKFRDEACRTCRIMPICNSGCSQGKLERDKAFACPQNKGEIEKRAHLIGALTQKLSNL